MRLQIFAFAIALLTTQVSCTSEPTREFRFLTSDDIPRNKAVVYIYRPPSVFGTRGVCNMKLNSELIGALNAAQYTYLFVKPAKTRFETTGTFYAFVTVNLQAGGEYFIKQTWVLGPTGFRPQIENMTKIKAEIDLRKCTYVETPPILEEAEEKTGQGTEEGRP